MDTPNNAAHPEGCACGACKACFWSKFNKACGGGAGCSSGCGFHSPIHRIVRLVLGIFIIILVFNFGIMIGELKSSIESGGGYGYHSHRSMMGDQGGRSMMRGGMRYGQYGQGSQYSQDGYYGDQIQIQVPTQAPAANAPRSGAQTR